MKFVLEIKEEAAARECFQRIVENGRQISDFKKLPVGPLFARAVDKFGIRWEVVIC